jgi:hypothetical protein
MITKMLSTKLQSFLKKWAQPSNILILLVLTGLTVLVCKLYFRPGFPYTHDGENHLARFANYKVALKEGQFPPRFAPNLMNHYGYPVFNYNYPLANIVSLPFSFLKLNYQLTFKLLATFSFIGSLLGTWWWLHKLNITRTLSIIVGLTASATAPFVVSMFYHRGNIGEIIVWGILPWLFALLTSPSQIKNRLLAVTAIGLWWGFFLSHNVTVLFATPLLLGYLLMQQPSKKVLLNNGALFLLGLAGSLWFWLPAILEKSAIILDNANLSVGFADHFVSWHQLLFSPFSFGFSKAGSLDSLSLGVGLAAIFGVVLMLLSGIKKLATTRNYTVVQIDRRWLFITATACACIIFQLAISEPVWNILPLVRFIQFPWRLSLFFSIFSAVLLAQVFTEANKVMKGLFIGLLLIQIVMISKAKPVDYFSRQIIDYDLFAQSTTTLNENLPKTFTYESFSATWQPQPTTQPASDVVVSHWTGSQRRYQLTTTQPTLVIEPTMAFLGWQTTLKNLNTNSEQPVEYVNDTMVGGRIAYQLDPGSYEVTTIFTQNTPARLLGNSISIISIGVVLIWLLLPVRHTLAHIKKR